MAHALVIWLMIWHHLVADGKATGLADPSVANKARAGPLSIEVSLSTLTRRRARIKRQLAHAFFGAAEQ